MRNLDVSDDTKEEIDTYLFAGFATLVGLTNLYFLIRGYLARIRALEQLHYSTPQMEELIYKEHRDSPMLAKLGETLPDCDLVKPGHQYVALATPVVSAT